MIFFIEKRRLLKNISYEKRDGIYRERERESFTKFGVGDVIVDYDGTSRKIIDFVKDVTDPFFVVEVTPSGDDFVITETISLESLQEGRFSHTKNPGK